MKKHLWALLAASVCCSVAIADSESCQPAKKYAVTDVDANKTGIDTVLRRLLKDTPLTLSYELPGDPVEVSLSGVTGNVSAIISAMGKKANFDWVQRGCEIRVVQRDEAQSISGSGHLRMKGGEQKTTWTLRQGVAINEQLAEWARDAKWEFEWQLDKAWIVPATVSFTGRFDQALEKAVRGLHKQGKPVRLVIWEGNRYAEVLDVDAK